MATLQKIRSHGPLLVIVIGCALFAFVAGDAWKVLQPHQAPNAGVVNGKKLSVQDYQNMVNEYTESAKLLQGLNTLTEEQTNYFRDLAWNNYVTNELIRKEADKLGLTVTDEEVKAIIEEGTDPLLQQSPFRNPQTGLFDKDMLKNFLAEYANMGKGNMPAQYMDYYRSMYNVWSFIEKSLVDQRLRQKYEALLGNSILSNPVEAKENYNYMVDQTNALLAVVPFNAVSDSAVKVSDADLKAAYDKKKEQFKQTVETRNVKYVDVVVTASPEDKEALQKEVKEYADELAKDNNDYKTFIRSTGSEVPFNDIFVSKKGMPADVASSIDNAEMGKVVEPYYNSLDNTINTYKVLGKTVLPDSIKFEQIQVQAQTPEKAHQLADSIYNVLKAGGDFAEIAKKNNQTLMPRFLTSAEYETAPLDGDNLNYINTLINTPANTYANISLPQGNIILKVLERKAMVDKYKVAVVKKNVDFSKETYNKAYNKFSQFIASNNTLEKLEKNAEDAGYKLLEVNGLTSNRHNIGDVRGTHDALKWAFEAKPGQVSLLYECGEGDHLMAVALVSEAPKGYVPFEQVKDMLKQEVINDKKAEKIIADWKAQNYNSFEACKNFQNVVTDSVKHVTFSADTYVPAVAASEPMVSAFAYATAKDKLTQPFKGNAGVYVLQPYAKDKLNEEYNQENLEKQSMNQNVRFLNRYLQDLYIKADVKDNRYLFFQ